MRAKMMRQNQALEIPAYPSSGNTVLLSSSGGGDLVAKSCPTLCNILDCSLPGSSVRGISQARILEWVAISFSRGYSRAEIEPGSPALQVDSLLTKHQRKSLVFYSFTKDLLYKYSSKDENVKVLLALISCD